MRILLAIVVSVAITASASSYPCPEGPPASPEVTTPATGVSFTTLTTGGGPHPGIYYIDNDPCQPDGCLFSVWLYEETNGIPGLQRDDITCDCTCYKPPSDTIIF